MYNQIHSIYYHNPLPDEFERMLNFYLRKGFNFISLDNLRRTLSGNSVIDGKNVFISFDDGWKDNLKLLPIIEKYNVPICIFVALEPLESGNFWWEFVKNEIGVERMLEFKKLPFDEFQHQMRGFRQRNIIERSAMTIEELKSLCGHPLVTIQSHTINHPILTSVPDDILDMELQDSRSRLEKISGKTVFAFSYPNGSLTDREMKACSRYYKMAFTTEQRHISIEDDMMLLPRVALTGDYLKDLLKIYGIWPIIKKLCRKK